MNIAKLVKWNLGQPYYKRKSVEEIRSMKENAREIADNNSLFRLIHAEAQLKLTKTPKWEDVE